MPMQHQLNSPRAEWGTYAMSDSAISATVRIELDDTEETECGNLAQGVLSGKEPKPCLACQISQRQGLGNPLHSNELGLRHANSRNFPPTWREGFALSLI